MFEPPPFKHGSLPPVHRHLGRFECVNYEIDLIGGEVWDEEAQEVREARHRAIVSVAYNDAGAPREVVFEGRGKIGQGVDLLLHDLSVKVSRILQDRDPETGEEL